MKTRLIAFLGIGLLALTPSAFAQSCEDSVAELFKSGPLNPLNRTGWRETTVQVAEDDSESTIIEAVWQNPARVRSVSNGTYIIAINSDTWTAPSEDGPWTASGATLPPDIEAYHQANNDALMRNVTEVSCPGEVEIDGRSLTKYIYRTVTDPNEYGIWFGGLFNTFIDPKTGKLARIEVSDSVGSWAPEPAKGKTVTTYSYDPTITIDPPE